MFTLNGLVAPSSKRPTFLIPFFSRPDTNQQFAQELAADFTVETFLHFVPNHFEAVASLAPALQIDVGDEGLLAFVEVSGNLVIDRASIVRERLAALPLETAEAPFFAVDALTLVGDEQRLTRAIHTASAAFSSRKIGASWKQRALRAGELRAVGRQLARSSAAEPKSDLEIAVEELRSNPERSDWVARWRSCVSSF